MQICVFYFKLYNFYNLICCLRAFFNFVGGLVTGDEVCLTFCSLRKPCFLYACQESKLYFLDNATLDVVAAVW